MQHIYEELFLPGFIHISTKCFVFQGKGAFQFFTEMRFSKTHVFGPTLTPKDAQTWRGREVPHWP